MKTNKFWRFMLLALFALSVAAAAILHFTPSQRETAAIYSGGEFVRSIRLTDARQSFTIHSDSGGYNVITVESKILRVTDAGCPDKLCVKQGALSANKPIVCLPHELVIELSGGSTDIDSAAG